MWWKKKDNPRKLIFRLRVPSSRQDAAKKLGEIGDARVIEPLIEALKDVDPLVRTEAGRALIRVIENTREVEPLTKALRVRNSPFLEKTLEALGKTGDVRAIEPLNKILEEEDERRHIREKAVEALAEIGSPAIESLIKVLGDTYWQVREKAVESLGNIGDPRVVEPLIHELEDEKRNPVQGKAAEILGKIGDTRAVRPLVNALEDENSEVRRKAAESLEMIGLPAIEILTTLHGEKRGNTSDKILEILKNIYASVNTIVLGNTSSKIPNPRIIWYNPDVSELTIPMSNLKRIEMYTESYNVLQVERFMTYAINYIGQKHLKKHVEVHIYGDPEKLHLNLQNAFKNLCKSVKVYGGQ
jgi:HEAT repeat protein